MVLKNVRDKNQFYHLARQVYPEDTDGLFLAYMNATEGYHLYLMLDLSLDTDDSPRARNCIFSDEAPPLIYVDICNETH